jgi:UDP-N-acetylglucosamine--N-acetylmuramyl-(pentapeptide) pyrophosphoryl-undecaprenol N-acetylglucosamine transferase
MKDILASSTVVAGRAGAGTIWECAALGKPMVLVPLAGSGTRGDQVENAMLAEKAGAARCLVGKDANAQELLEAILEYLEDAAKLEKAQRAALALAQIKTEDGRLVSSASFIAQLILQQVNDHEERPLG